MGFANPAAWLLAALYAVLIALYLWEHLRRRIDVPSLLLWQLIPEEPVRANTFRPDLLFLLQLLLLTFLIGGLAQPYLRRGAPLQQPTRHVFVLDVSASMQAREGRRTRFDEARAALERRIAALGTEDEAMLIAAANTPRTVVPFSRDHQALRQRLASITPIDAGANLNLALAVAQSAAARGDLPTRITAFTDTAPSDLDPTWREGVEIEQIGETDDNIAIQALEISQGRFQDYRQAHAQIVVRNFSHHETHGFLTLTLDGNVISRRGFSLPPRDARSFLVRNFDATGILDARLEADDALSADNHAWGWIRPQRPVRMLVVSPPSPLQAQLSAIANATANLQIRFVEPQAYNADASGEFDVVLFHRFVPATEPHAARFYIYPPADNARFPVHTQLADAPILAWNDQHPVLRALQPIAPFPIAQVAVLEAPPWADLLLSTRNDDREIPLAFAGEHDQYRTACITFDLGRENLLNPDNVGFLLLFLNLVDWLTPIDESVVMTTTGSVVTLTNLPGLPRRVSDPHGQVTTYAPAATLSVDVVYAGEYSVATNGTRRKVMANFFDAAESDIGRSRKEAPAFVRPQGASKSTAAGATFGPWLYAAALAFLVIEWLVAVRRA